MDGFQGKTENRSKAYYWYAEREPQVLTQKDAKQIIPINKKWAAAQRVRNHKKLRCASVGLIELPTVSGTKYTVSYFC